MIGSLDKNVSNAEILQKRFITFFSASVIFINKEYVCKNATFLLLLDLMILCALGTCISIHEATIIAHQVMVQGKLLFNLENKNCILIQAASSVREFTVFLGMVQHFSSFSQEYRQYAMGEGLQGG